MGAKATVFVGLGTQVPEEAYATLAPDWIKNTPTPPGVAVTTLLSDFAALTGTTPPPAPTPVTPPSPTPVTPPSPTPVTPPVIPPMTVTFQGTATLDPASLASVGKANSASIIQIIQLILAFLNQIETPPSAAK